MRTRAVQGLGDTVPVAFVGLLGCACLLPVLLMFAELFLSGQPSPMAVAAACSNPARLLTLAGNTAAVAAGAVAISLLFGVPPGFLFFRTDIPLRQALLVGCIVCACIPLYVTATGWMALLGMERWLYNVWGAAWITGVAYAPLVTLITGVSFAAVDRDLEEAALLETGRYGVFRHSTLPAARWGVAVAAATVLILSLWDITVTDILAVRTFGEEVFTRFQLHGNAGAAMALALPVILLLAAAMTALVPLLKHHGRAAGHTQTRPRCIRLSGLRYPLLALFLLIAAFLYGAPLAALFKALGSPLRLLSACRTCGEELLGTVQLVPASAVVAVLIAIVAAWFLVRSRRLRIPVGLGLLSLLAVPAPIVGIGLIKLLDREGIGALLYDSRAAVVAAYVIRTLPFGILALVPAAHRVPQQLRESLAMDGGNRASEIRFLFIPSAWRSILAAGCLVLILCLSEIGASFLVVPPGRTTLSIRFFTLIHYGVYPDAAGVCLILLLAVAAGAFGLSWAARPFLRERLS